MYCTKRPDAAGFGDSGQQLLPNTFHTRRFSPNPGVLYYVVVQDIRLTLGAHERSLARRSCRSSVTGDRQDLY